MRVIPAIDVLNGKVVRLSQGDFSQVTNYLADPVEQAKDFQRQGFTHLHLVDLDGAKSGRVQNAPLLEKIKRETNLTIDFGGGVKTTTELEILFSLGAQQVNIGSLAIIEPKLFSDWLARYGGERFILSADVRNGSVYINGWTKDSGKKIEEVIRHFQGDGLQTVTCTDISKDGMLTGPAVDFYLKLKKNFPDLKIIASGGVSTVNDLVDLKQAGCSAAIAGKALLEGKISIEDLLNNQLIA